MSTLLRLEDVCKRYPMAGGDLRVLDGVSLTIERGDALAIVGPSGSGKSTLLHLMGGLDVPSSGRVLLGDRDLAALDEDGRAAARRRDVGFVFQAPVLLPHLSALDNVLVPTLAEANPTEQARRDDEARARALLDRVGLGARLASRPAQLSGGERMRLAIARALLTRPKVLLADEPTGSLDRATAASITDLLRDLNREESTALVVATHDERLAARMGRVLHLEGGKLGPSPARSTTTTA